MRGHCDKKRRIQGRGGIERVLIQPAIDDSVAHATGVTKLKFLAKADPGQAWPIFLSAIELRNAESCRSAYLLAVSWWYSRDPSMIRSLSGASSDLPFVLKYFSPFLTQGSPQLNPRLPPCQDASTSSPLARNLDAQSYLFTARAESGYTTSRIILLNELGNRLQLDIRRPLVYRPLIPLSTIA